MCIRDSCNARYLADAPFPDSLLLANGDSADLLAQAQACDLVVLAAPMAALRGLLKVLHGCRAPVAWLCKGFEASSPDAGSFGLLGHEIRAQVAPQLLAGALSGPSFAQEVAAGRPTALVAARPRRHPSAKWCVAVSARRTNRGGPVEPDAGARFHPKVARSASNSPGWSTPTSHVIRASTPVSR